MNGVALLSRTRDLAKMPKEVEDKLTTDAKEIGINFKEMCELPTSFCIN